MESGWQPPARSEIPEERFDGEAPDPVDPEPLTSPIEKDSSGFRIILAERAKSAQVGGLNARRVLDLEGHEDTWPVDDKVDLHSRPRAPKRDLRRVRFAGPRVRRPGAEVFCNETLQ